MTDLFHIGELCLYRSQRSGVPRSPLSLDQTEGQKKFTGWKLHFANIPEFPLIWFFFLIIKPKAQSNNKIQFPVIQYLSVRLKSNPK